MKYVFYVIFPLLLILTNCNNDKGKSNKLIPSIKYDDTLSISLSFLQPSYEVQMLMRYYDNKLNQNINCRLDSTQWRNLLGFIQEYTFDKSEIWLIVLYTDKHLCKVDSVKLNNISAFQIYTIKPNKKLYHSIFVLQNDAFIELKQFDCESVGIYSKVVDYFINNEIMSYNSNEMNYSLINLYSDVMFSYVPHKYSHDYLMRRIEKYGKKKY